MSLGLRLSRTRPQLGLGVGLFGAAAVGQKEFAWRSACSSIYKGSTSDYVLLALNFTRKQAGMGELEVGKVLTD